MFFLKSFLALSIAVLASAVVDAQVPTPYFAVDFSDPDSVDANAQLVTASVSTGPGDVDALRIDECGKHAILPVNINPDVMPDVTLALNIYLESVVEGSLGWPLSSDDGGYDRSIVLHDSRFGGMGMASGYATSVWGENDDGQPPLQQWMQIVAVFSQSGLVGSGTFYVNGEAAPVEIETFNYNGRTDLVVGTNLFSECTHWTDSWIKEVQVFDSALTSTEVTALSDCFFGVLDGDEECEFDSSSDSEDEGNLFEDMVDSIFGSSAPTVVVAKGLAVALLLGTLLGL